MELVLTTEDFEPLPKQNEDLICEPSGFLNSYYKSIVNENYKKQKPTSIFALKQRIRSKCHTTNCIAATTLRLSVFLTVILLIFN
jgi:hypothetical protein